MKAAAGLLLVLCCLVRMGEAAETQPVLTPLHYDLRIQVNYEDETIDGSASIRIKNLSEEPAASISFLLYRLLSADSVTDGAGGELDYSQNVVAFSDFSRLQVNHVVVSPGEPVPPGGTTTVRINYSGHMLGYAETGMSYTQDHIAPDFTILRDDTWAFPMLGYPSVADLRGAPEQMYTYRAGITVPRELTVASGGKLVAVEESGALATYVYESVRPSFRMDFAISDYGVMTEGVVRIHYFVGDEHGAAQVARAARRALDLYTSWFGPLRGESALTFIEIPDGYGSQTAPGTIIQSAGAFRDSTRHGEVYHEVSHLWNAPATDRPSPRWEEGLAMFLQYVVIEEAGGAQVVDERADRLITWLGQQIEANPRWREVPPIEYGSANLTDLSYTVGGLMFDLYYRLVGQDAFQATVGEYYQRYYPTGGSTEDFVRLASERSPVDLEQFFDDWIYTSRWTERVLESDNHEDLVRFYK